ncbi:TadE/TadG family type IV pilus assembly protein [Caulobacter sp. RHG1]|uniref:TadE/TadG family type IV pilus assembly protein n=1 Tax=Caulobacter sp. (strain RHG1) TaxID=2545762 RepID=UPI001552DEC4|nr:TadE/TadG family type IV pilus assembly protein [Caulobacter sp. RHG1]NQE63999.1 Superfamily I DNA and RNA helicase [Caulobacter sp. RHG1]
MTRRARPTRPLIGFWRDRRGVSAIEFALIAPVLILMYCGMAELTQAMMAQRRLSNITSTIGDLIAQTGQTGPLKMADTFTIGKIIMAPFPEGNLSMCVASITSDASGKDTVAWSQTSNAGVTCPKQGVVVTDVSVGVLPANQSVILARASYAYTSPIKFVLSKPLTFTRTYYLRPRKSDVVLWNKEN